MNLRKCRLVMIVVCTALCVLCLAVKVDAKAWLNGHIAELRPDGFVLQTRFYRYIVHTDDVEVRCKKQRLPLSDLQLHDLVTVEGRYRYDDTVDATKVTIHRDFLACREIKGPKPAHCKC
jgi:hypothetical protein